MRNKISPLVIGSKRNKVRHIYLIGDDPYFATMQLAALKKNLEENNPDEHIIIPLLGIRHYEKLESRYGSKLKRLALMFRDLRKEYLHKRNLKSEVLKTSQDTQNKNIRFISIKTWIMLQCKFVIRSLKIKSKLSAADQIKELKIGNIKPGELIMSSYLRYKPKARLDIDDNFIITLLVVAHALHEVYMRLARTDKRIIFYGAYSTYIHHGVPFRTMLSEGATAVTFGALEVFYRICEQGSYFPTFSPNYHAYKNPRKEFDLRLIIKAKEMLDQRIKGEYLTSMPYMPQSRKISTEEVLSPAVVDSRKIIFMPLHDFFDSPHIYKWMLFDDFWEWSCISIEKCIELGYDIVIKPHPNQIEESQNVVSKLKKKYNNSSKIHWIESKVRNGTIFKLNPILVLSVYGSIAPEATYAGVKTLLAGDHPGIRYNIGMVAETRDQYFQLLANPEKIPKANQQEALFFTAEHFENILTGEGDSLMTHCGLTYKQVSKNPAVLQNNECKEYVDKMIGRLIEKLEDLYQD